MARYVGNTCLLFPGAKSSRTCSVQIHKALRIQHPSERAAAGAHVLLLGNSISLRMLQACHLVHASSPSRQVGGLKVLPTR